MKFKKKFTCSILAFTLISSNLMIASANTNQQTEETSYMEEQYYKMTSQVKREYRSTQGKWSNENGKWYYIKNGVKQKGWQRVSNKWYYLNNAGQMQTGWEKVNGVWYYLNSSGEMQTGWQQIGNQWYYLNNDGSMKTGWQRVSNKWYYLNNDGQMQTGWEKINGAWYYLNSSGEMQIGWQKIDNKWYYLSSDGQMQTGWQQISDKWYYMYDSGIMAANTIINGSKINQSGDAQSLNQSQEIKVIDINTNLSEIAGKSLTDKIKVSQALGRKVHLQMLNPTTKHWETKKVYTTGNEKESIISLEYPSIWYNQVSSSWRVYIPPVLENDSYVSEVVNVTAKRVYNNAPGYIQIKDKITVEESGANLVSGTMGLRVAQVQRKLGMGHRWEKVDSATMSKVKEFQRKNGLKATGVVDLTTWKKLGFTEESWYSLDRNVTPIKTNLTSTKEDHIETMINTAMSYVGTEYIVGAAGKPGQGIDCSGLVMQSMYSVGIDPSPISVVRHSKPGYEYESRNLFKLPTLKHVKYENRKRGDLIFYKDSKGTIIHVAIYLGNDQVVESWPEKVVVWPIKNSHRARIAGVARVFE